MIDLQALSITKTINAIISFFRSQENNSAWKDLTTGAEGLFLIRLLANVMTNISYRLVSARRENFLSTANLLSSNIGIAVNLGYSVYRGRNQHRRIQVTPLRDYTIPKFTAIGTYDEYSIVTLEDLTLVTGVKQEFEVVIGNVKTITINPDTQAIKLFQQFEENISEDYMLTVDGQEVPTTKNMKDMVDDKYLVRTNPYNSVDIMYLNNAQLAKYTYSDESEIILKYIELADVPTQDFTSEMFSYVTLDNVLTISNYVPFESVSNIKINAPIDHEVQNLIRSKADYSKRVKQIVPNVKQTSYYPITPTYTLVTYLKDDYSFLSTGVGSETETIMGLLVEENFFGTPLPDITYPRREVTPLNITLKVTNKYMDINDIQNDINNLLATNYETLLEQTFNVYDFERLLENSLAYVTYARVELNVEARQNNTQNQLGSVINVDDVNYKASYVLGLSSAISPNWQVPSTFPKQIDLGTETEDGELIWHAYKLLPYVENIKTWQSSTKYKIGDYVTVSGYDNVMFKCVNMKKLTGSTIPTIPVNITTGEFIIDGNVIWVCVNYNDSYEGWIQGSKKLGDTCNIGGYSFQCISFAEYTGGIEPTFESDRYDIIDTTSSTFVVSGNVTDYIGNGDIIQVVTETGDIYSFGVNSTEYSQETLTDVGETTITVAQTINTDIQYSYILSKRQGTYDGNICWEIIDDIDNVSYGWNVYNTFEYNLTIK